MRGVCVAVCLWGCSDPTTILISARVASGEATPQSLAVSVFDAHGARVLDRALGAARLPGTLLITGLSDEAQSIRVVLAGSAPRELGWARVPTEPHQQVRAAIELSTNTADSDGDGVPDAADDCPDVSDAQQHDANGDGAGDACGGADQGVPADLSGIDLNGVDLARSFSDGAIDAGGGTKCPGSFLFCDGFENGFNNGVWARRLDRGDDGGMPTVDVDTTHAYRGTHSLRAHVDPLAAMDTYIQAKARQSMAAPTPTVFVRVFVFLSASLMSENTALLSLEQEVDPYGGEAIEIDQGGKLVLDNYTSDPGPTINSAQTIPFGQWVCLEWQANRGATMTSDMGTGSIHVWVNDVEVNDLNLGGLVHQPFFGSTSFGLELNNSQPLPALDLWMDEIAVDAARIGCTN